jgi:hypothetical protein
LKPIDWKIVGGLVAQHGGDGDPRELKMRAHLVAMLYAQFCGARSLREVETNLKSHAGTLGHLGGCTVSRPTLSSANASRPALCDLAVQDDAVVLAHAGNKTVIGGRYGTRFRSAFCVRTPVATDRIVDVRPVEVGADLPDPEISLQNRTR